MRNAVFVNADLPKCSSAGFVRAHSHDAFRHQRPSHDYRYDYYQPPARAWTSREITISKTRIFPPSPGPKRPGLFVFQFSNMNAQTSLTFETIEQAHARLAERLRATPCTLSERLSDAAGMMIWAKHDYLQATGSFKERGALNALSLLTPAQRGRGVIAASAGNHALGLAYHGRALGVAVTVVMPRLAPRVKAGRCHALGAHVVLHGENFDEAARHARELATASGKTYVHPYDDEAVIAGQGTLALEVLYAFPELEAIVVPVGGGGLLAGVATVVKTLRPEVLVIGAEPAHAASFSAALVAGRPVPAPVLPSLADGLLVAQAGLYPFAQAHALVDRVVTVSEQEIAAALWLVHEREGLALEGAGVTALAACLSGRLPELAGKRVAVPFTGKNIDPSTHARALRLARVECVPQLV